VDEKRKSPERRRLTRSGRRASDPQPNLCICLETRKEVARLSAVVQILTDAVQALTAAQKKP
jgi:hypothetical protein